MPTITEHLLGGRAGETKLIPVDLVITDDWTTPSLLRSLEELRGIPRQGRSKLILVYDHAVDPARYQGKDRERVCENLRQLELFEQAYTPTIIRGKGIQHHVLPEENLLKPGMIIVGNDSHTCTLGCYHVYAKAMQPIGVAVALHTGKIPVTIPYSLGVRVSGRLRPGVTVKDAMLYLLALLDRTGRATGRVIEYFGDGLEDLSVEEATVFTNMSSEAVATTALFPMTQSLQKYYETRNIPLTRIFAADPEAYTEIVELDLHAILPCIAQQGSPAAVVPVHELEGTHLDQVFIGTCTGGKYDDIRQAWEQIRGKHVKIPTLVFFATEAIRQRCEQKGIIQDLREAGVTVMYSGCGPCFGFGTGRMQPHQVTLSTGNRNYQGRMGDQTTKVLLASSVTAGYSAIAGCLRNPFHYDADMLSLNSIPHNLTSQSSSFLRHIDNSTLWLAGDSISTDDITPSSVPGIGTTSATDPNILRQLAFYYLCPSFSREVKPGDILVAGHNFGKGSNRASSVLALQALGIRAVIAKSFSPLYAEGALFYGFPLLTLEEDFFEEFEETLHSREESSGSKITPHLEINGEIDTVTMNGKSYKARAISPLMQKIIQKHGVLDLLRDVQDWKRMEG
ncbi:hypothetical protein HYW21_00175 [Candidatus Woesearchaeota archaeon]|nr:hypothetical protein [Candidatus Woesearchaeota archaeon]